MPSFESIHLALPATQRSYLAYNSGISVFFGSFRHPLHQHGKLRIPRCVQTLCVPGEEFIDRQSLASLQQSGVDVSTAAELGFYVPIGANVSSSSSKQYYKACSQRVSQQSLAGIPMPAPACGGELCSDYTAWEQAVDANPMPIRITLASIVKLLVPKYFPSDHNITAKATQLAAFLATGYCGDVPSCGPAPPAPPLACASSCPTSRCNTTTGLCASCPTKVENEDCSRHGTCSHLSGACTCDSGFAGPLVRLRHVLQS